MLRDGQTGDWIGTFIGHKGAVWQARLSSDGNLAATGSADFSAKVWDTHTGECLSTLQHNHIVRAVAFPGGEARILATGGQEKKLRIFDLSRSVSAAAEASSAGAAGGLTNGTSSSSDPPSYEIGPGIHGGTIKSIVWSTDLNILTTASDDKKVRWWDLRTRSPICDYTVDGLIGSCEFNESPGDSSSGTGVLSVAAGKAVYFFDGAKPGSLIKSVATPYDIASVALHADQRKFVTGTAGDTWVRVWDFDEEKEIGERSYLLASSHWPYSRA